MGGCAWGQRSASSAESECLIPECARVCPGMMAPQFPSREARRYRPCFSYGRHNDRRRPSGHTAWSSESGISGKALKHQPDDGCEVEKRTPVANHMTDPGEPQHRAILLPRKDQRLRPPVLPETAARARGPGSSTSPRKCGNAAADHSQGIRHARTSAEITASCRVGEANG